MRGLLVLAAATGLLRSACAVELMRSEGAPVEAAATTAGSGSETRRRRMHGFCENDGKECHEHEGCGCKGAALLEAEAEAAGDDVRAALLQRKMQELGDGAPTTAGGLDKTTCAKNDRYNCKEAVIEDIAAAQKPDGKLEPKGRCFNDITKKCASKYECAGGAHSCIWADADIEGGKCKESKNACRGRWDCSKGTERTGFPTMDFEECIAPKKCEHDQTKICDADEHCGVNTRCLERCKVDMWPTHYVMQCVEDKPCYWEDPATGHYMFFERRNDQHCLPVCEEEVKLVEGVEHAKVTCPRRPFKACYSALSHAMCSYGEGYNGVDEDVTEAERCSCTKFEEHHEGEQHAEEHGSAASHGSVTSHGSTASHGSHASGH